MNRLIQLNELTDLLAKHTSLPPQLCNTFVCYMSGISAATLVKHKALEIPGLGLLYVQNGKVKFNPSIGAEAPASQPGAGNPAPAPAPAPKAAAPVAAATIVESKPEAGSVIDTDLLTTAAGVVEQILEDTSMPKNAVGDDPFRVALLSEIEEEEYEEITKPIFLQNLASDDPSTESTDPILPNTQPQQPETPQPWNPQAPQAPQQPETPQPWIPQTPQAPQQPETPQLWNPQAPQAPQQPEAPQPWNPQTTKQPEAPQPWAPKPTKQPEASQPWNPQPTKQPEVPQPWAPQPTQQQSSQWGSKTQPTGASTAQKADEEADRRRHEILGGYSNNRWGSREKNQKKKKYIRIATIAAASIVVLILLAILIPKITSYLKSDSKPAEQQKVTVPATPANQTEPQVAITDTVAGDSEEYVSTGIEEAAYQSENTGSLEGNDEYRYDIISSSRTLVQMARDYYGHKDYWVYIYLDNQDVISNPNSIKSGTKLRIPPRSKYDVSGDPMQNLRDARKLGSQTLQKFNQSKQKTQNKPN